VYSRPHFKTAERLRDRCRWSARRTWYCRSSLRKGCHPSVRSIRRTTKTAVSLCDASMPPLTFQTFVTSCGDRPVAKRDSCQDSLWDRVLTRASKTKRRTSRHATIRKIREISRIIWLALFPLSLSVSASLCWWDLTFSQTGSRIPLARLASELRCSECGAIGTNGDSGGKRSTRVVRLAGFGAGSRRRARSFKIRSIRLIVAKERRRERPATMSVAGKACVSHSRTSDGESGGKKRSRLNLAFDTAHRGRPELRKIGALVPERRETWFARIARLFDKQPRCTESQPATRWPINARRQQLKSQISR